MGTFEPADNLRSRTFVGLLVAQFLAAFNDQAIHASAMFFAINQNAMSEANAISLMPILFYAPWAIFCTLAGYLADRYSKWNSLVFWKVAEVAITLVALLGFWLGTHGQPAGPFLVLSTVFLMGMHSAFFVPAKYGAMPEILRANMLSRGNGLLESLSFLAVILGTVFGGVLSKTFRGQEYMIGAILVALAVIGAVASLLMRRMPAANPTRHFPPYLYRPLWENIRTLLRSRPLALAVIGIAFFTFIVAFMRCTVYMHGQSHVPRWDEDKTSEVVGMVALGIGLGSPLVGFLSGGKVELGLVPVGALGMIAATLVAALVLGQLPWLILCIVLIGFFTGFYIVPLFTLLQHRAPKTSKGDSIATSNFINVTGAIAASVLFKVLVLTAHLSGITPALPQKDQVAVGVLLEDPEYQNGRPHRVVIGQDPVLPAVGAGTAGFLGSPAAPGPLLAASAAAAGTGPVRVVRARDNGKRHSEIDVDEDLIDGLVRGLKRGDRVIESTYQLGAVKHHRIRREGQELEPVYNDSGLPRLLFVGAGGMTLFTLLLLWGQLPDLFLRTLVWLRMQRRYRLEVAGMHHLPGHGPMILATNAGGVDPCLHVLSATDRTTRFLLADGDGERLPGLLLPLLARTGLVRVREDTADSGGDPVLRSGEKALGRKEVVALPLGDAGANGSAERVLGELGAQAPVVPVYYEVAPAPAKKRRQRVYVVGGPPLPAGASAEAVRAEIRRLGEEFRKRKGGMGHG
jgi:MFS family permease